MIDENITCPKCDSGNIKKKGWSDNKRYRRYQCKSCGVKFQDSTKEIVIEKAQFQDKFPEGNKYVITAAQNATPVNENFFNALLTYCKHNNAQLVVIPYRYSNPTSLWSKNQEHDEWWDEKLVPYLYAKRKKLNNNIEIMGDVKTQPTAVNPLSGMEALSKGLSAIFGHPRLQLKTVPTPQNQLPCIMTTTGAVTVKNFTDTKAGKKGDFHFTSAASVVEIESQSVFHLRQINAMQDGSFVDWDREYFPDGKVKKAPRPLSLTMGDSHIQSMDPKVEKATFYKNGLVDQLNPEVLVWHDLFDGLSINPHHRGDPFTAYAKAQSNLNLVRDEVYKTIQFLIEKTGKRKSVVVGSNHDDFLKRWLMNTDWKNDIQNAEFYLETALAMIRHSKMVNEGAYVPNPLAYWIEKFKGDKDVACPRAGESYMIGEIEHGFHGHKGPNGAKGTIKNLSQMGVKINIGHTHSPGIEGGAYQAGTNTYLNLDYASESPSSWMQSDILTYYNSKRTLVNIIGGNFKI